MELLERSPSLFMQSGNGRRIEADSGSHGGADGDALEVRPLRGGGLRPHDRIEDGVHVVGEPLHIERSLSHRNVDDARLLEPELDLAGLRLAYRAGHVRGDRSDL